jgi:hypothetical protein
VGRPKGSKNKPKVTDTSKPLPKVKDTSVLSKASQKIVEKGLKQAKEGKLEDLAPLLEEEEVGLEDVLHDTITKEEPEPEKGLKRPSKNLKHVIEKVDFLMEEIKGLRAYIRRLEDAFVYQNGKEALPEGSDYVSSVKSRKRRIKPSTNETEEKESKNETETE